MIITSEGLEWKGLDDDDGREDIKNNVTERKGINKKVMHSRHILRETKTRKTNCLQDESQGRREDTLICNHPMCSKVHSCIGTKKGGNGHDFFLTDLKGIPFSSTMTWKNQYRREKNTCEQFPSYSRDGSSCFGLNLVSLFEPFVSF